MRGGHTSARLESRSRCRSPPRAQLTPSRARRCRAPRGSSRWWSSRAALEGRQYVCEHLQRIQRRNRTANGPLYLIYHAASFSTRVNTILCTITYFRDSASVCVLLLFLLLLLFVEVQTMQNPPIRCITKCSISQINYVKFRGRRGPAGSAGPVRHDLFEADFPVYPEVFCAGRY